MKDGGGAKETNNREEDLKSISWQAGRDSRTMGPERHEIRCSNEHNKQMSTISSHHQHQNHSFAENGGKNEKRHVRTRFFLI